MEIHDLNDFVGALGEGTFMALDNGQDTGKISLADLFASDSFTTLWSGNTRLDSGDEIALSKPITDFEFLDVYYQNGSADFLPTPETSYIRVPTSAAKIGLKTIMFEDAQLWLYKALLSVSTNKLTVDSTARWGWSGAASDPASYSTEAAAQIWITRIDGIATPANNKSIFKLRTATLAAADWVNSSQTVDVEDVTATNSVLVCADPASQTDFMTYGVNCVAQGTDSLTFTCASTPASDLTVNVMVIG